jgi:hypothetical protein
LSPVNLLPDPLLDESMHGLVLRILSYPNCYIVVAAIYRRDSPTNRARFVPAHPHKRVNQIVNALMMLLRHDESIARAAMAMRRESGYLPQLPKYAGATRCWAVY